MLHVCLVYIYLRVSGNRFKQARTLSTHSKKGLNSGAKLIRKNGSELVGLIVFFRYVLFFQFEVYECRVGDLLWGSGS